MYLPALILIYTGIDTSGWLASSNPSDKVGVRFCRWAERWALPAKPLACTATELYAARCGILHTFTSDSGLSAAGKARRVCYAVGSSTVQQLQASLDTQGRTDCVAVHLDDLFDAFRLGLANYLEHAFADPAQKMQLARKAERCFTIVAGEEAARFHPGAASSSSDL